MYVKGVLAKAILEVCYLTILSYAVYEPIFDFIARKYCGSSNLIDQPTKVRFPIKHVTQILESTPTRIQFAMRRKLGQIFATSNSLKPARLN